MVWIYLLNDVDDICYCCHRFNHLLVMCWCHMWVLTIMIILHITHSHQSTQSTSLADKGDILMIHFRLETGPIIASIPSSISLSILLHIIFISTIHLTCPFTLSIDNFWFIWCCAWFLCLKYTVGESVIVWCSEQLVLLSVCWGRLVDETLEILILVTLDVSLHKSDITKESGYSQIGYSNTQQFFAPLAVSADPITDLDQTVIRLIFSVVYIIHIICLTESYNFTLIWYQSCIR